MFNFLFVNLSLFSQAAASLSSCSSPQIRDCKFLKFSTSRSGVCEEISCGLHHQLATYQERLFELFLPVFRSAVCPLFRAALQLSFEEFQRDKDD